MLITHNKNILAINMKYSHKMLNISNGYIHLGPSDVNMNSLLSCCFQLPEHLVNEAVRYRK